VKPDPNATVSIELEGENGPHFYVLTDPPSRGEDALAGAAGAGDDLGSLHDLVEMLGFDRLVEFATTRSQPVTVDDARGLLWEEPLVDVDGEDIVWKVPKGYITSCDGDPDGPFPTVVEALRSTEMPEWYETISAPGVDARDIAEALGLDGETEVFINGERFGPEHPGYDRWQSDNLRDEPGFDILAEATGFYAFLSDNLNGSRLGRVGDGWFVDNFIGGVLRFDDEAAARREFAEQLEHLEDATWTVGGDE